MIDVYLITSTLKLDRFAAHYRVRMNPEEALAFFRLAKPRCECHRSILYKFIDLVNGAVPLMNFGPENANTGKPHHSFWVGRETSRVIYLDIAKLSILLGKEKQFDFDKLGNDLIEIAKQHHAYEATITRNDGLGFECRFWWKLCAACQERKET